MTLNGSDFHLLLNTSLIVAIRTLECPLSLYFTMYLKKYCLKSCKTVLNYSSSLFKPCDMASVSFLPIKVTFMTLLISLIA